MTEATKPAEKPKRIRKPAKRLQLPPGSGNGEDHPTKWDWPQQMTTDEFKRRAAIIRKMPAQGAEEKRIKYQMLGMLGNYFSPKGFMIREQQGE